MPPVTPSITSFLFGGLARPLGLGAGDYSPMVPFGTFGVIDNRLGDYSTLTTEFTFAGETLANGTNLANAFSAHGAARGPVFGLFAGGIGIAPFDMGQTSSEKYNISTRAVSAGSMLARVLPGSFANTPRVAADSNINVGWFNCVFRDTDVNNNSVRYTWAAEVSTLSTVIGANPRGDTAAGGNGTVTVMCDGATSNGITTAVINQTNKYTFADESVATGVALATPRARHGARSDGGEVLFASGVNGAINPITSVERYTLPDGGRAAAAALGISKEDAAAIGNATFAFFAGGQTNGANNTATRRHEFATNTEQASTALASGSLSQSGF